MLTSIVSLWAGPAGVIVARSSPESCLLMNLFHSFLFSFRFRSHAHPHILGPAWSPPLNSYTIVHSTFHKLFGSTLPSSLPCLPYSNSFQDLLFNGRCLCPRPCPCPCPCPCIGKAISCSRCASIFISSRLASFVLRPPSIFRLPSVYSQIVQRDTFANLFHDSEDFVNAFLAMAILRMAPGETQIFITDLYPKGPFA